MPEVLEIREQQQHEERIQKKEKKKKRLGAYRQIMAIPIRFFEYLGVIYLVFY